MKDKAEYYSEPAPPSVLFFDHDGGYGGSSRSLFLLLKNINKKQCHPVVVTLKNGPLVEWLKGLKISVSILTRIPKFRPTEKKCFFVFVLFVLSLFHMPTLALQLKRLKKNFNIEILHANHENLGLSVFLFSKILHLPWVCHIRTQLAPNIFSRFVCKIIARNAQKIIFITDQNLTHFAALAGKSFDLTKAATVRNIAPEIQSQKTHSSLLNENSRFKVLSLSNFSPNRGVDRIIDVAIELKKLGRKDFEFYLFGHAANKMLLSGASNPYTQNMIKKVQDNGLEDMVMFPGHTSTPEAVLANADAVIKLTRQANPWGRDIIEGLAAGLPIITLGAYEGFVENTVNGYIELEYYPERIANYLVLLRDNPSYCEQVGKNNREKAKRLFDGETNAGLVANIYQKILLLRFQ